jgi:hypothetical protein
LYKQNFSLMYVLLAFSSVLRSVCLKMPSILYNKCLCN